MAYLLQSLLLTKTLVNELFSKYNEVRIITSKKKEELAIYLGISADNVWEFALIHEHLQIPFYKTISPCKPANTKDSPKQVAENDVWENITDSFSKTELVSIGGDIHYNDHERIVCRFSVPSLTEDSLCETDIVFTEFVSCIPIGVLVLLRDAFPTSEIDPSVWAKSSIPEITHMRRFIHRSDTYIKRTTETECVVTRLAPHTTKYVVGISDSAYISRPIPLSGKIIHCNAVCTHCGFLKAPTTIEKGREIAEEFTQKLDNLLAPYNTHAEIFTREKANTLVRSVWVATEEGEQLDYERELTIFSSCIVVHPTYDDGRQTLCDLLSQCKWIESLKRCVSQHQTQQ
jgi:hypothetical protein